MLPPSKYIIKCPNCDEFIIKKVLSSGNTFGSKFYSDGVRVSPMLPEYSRITKCKKCSNYFWVEDAETISFIKDIGDEEFEKENIQIIKPLSIEELFLALNSDIIENEEQEVMIRKMIWKFYNDRVRDGNEMFLSEQDEKMWFENHKRLFIYFYKNPPALLDKELLIISEIARNFEKFDQAIKFLGFIKDLGYTKIKDQMIEACKNGNKNVIEIIE